VARGSVLELAFQRAASQKAASVVRRDQIVKDQGVFYKIM